MKLIPIDQIEVSPNRQRREFPLDKLNELAQSIQEKGLFHPLAIREERPDPAMEGVGGFYILVSGERRLRAIKDIYELGGSFKCNNEPVPPGMVPTLTLGELDELAREEAEWDENYHRSNLTWQEHADGTRRLADLRSRQADAGKVDRPTIADIAQERRGSSEGIHHETTRREIIVAQHLDDPEVRGAKDVNEAFKVLKRKEETERRTKLAVEVGRTFSTKDHTVLNEDSLAWMMSCAPAQFDVILTDPIYGIGADEFGDSGGHAEGAHKYDDSYEKWQADVTVLAHEGFRITKPQAHFYAFCDITRFQHFKSILEYAGWKVFRTPIVWHKPNGNRLPWVEQGPQRKYEIIIYAVKGDKKVTKIYPDLVSYTADENLGHNAQKPAALFLDLLRRSCSAGDRILDPFGGSGPLLPAAHELKCKATVIEQDPSAYGICLKRLEKLNEQPELEGM